MSVFEDPAIDDDRLATDMHATRGWTQGRIPRPPKISLNPCKAESVEEKDEDDERRPEMKCRNH
jgi:hypothetical protein